MHGTGAVLIPCLLYTSRTWYRITLNIRNPLKLPKDSRALIATPGLLAAPLVEIKEGQSSELIANGGEIPGAPTANLMESVANLANDLGQLTETSLKPLLAQVSKKVETCLLYTSRCV